MCIMQVILKVPIKPLCHNIMYFSSWINKRPDSWSASQHFYLGGGEVLSCMGPGQHSCRDHFLIHRAVLIPLILNETCSSILNSKVGQSRTGVACQRRAVAQDHDNTHHRVIFSTEMCSFTLKALGKHLILITHEREAGIIPVF